MSKRIPQSKFYPRGGLAVSALATLMLSDQSRPEKATRRHSHHSDEYSIGPSKSWLTQHSVHILLPWTRTRFLDNCFPLKGQEKFLLVISRATFSAGFLPTAMWVTPMSFRLSQPQSLLIQNG